ncbi:signal peptidase I [Sutcliffiella cohnii]|uniref:signal peptidase I n=1 Tax=Sutcliffiella cohnii TaxID=33932 RepID=UPI002E20400E|nr:signal peptidase I [Sutcliffiella cohnii]
MKYYLLVSFLAMSLIACSDNTSEKIVKDEITTEDIVMVANVTSEMIIHHHMYDNMDRGSHEFYDKTLVIDSKVNRLDISRGDVVFFDNKDGNKDISRVVALPGEKIKITDGQIYINGSMLDSFYGKAHRLGFNEETYFENMDEGGIEYNKDSMKELFKANMTEIKLSNDQFFLISDDWFRGTRMVISEGELIGTVLGYLN